MTPITDSASWTSDCKGVTRRPPYFRGRARARRGWARRGPGARKARRWRCGCRVCRRPAPNRKASASVYRSRKSDPWAHLFSSPPRRAPGVRLFRRKTSTGRPRLWNGGTVIQLYLARRSSGALSPILRSHYRHADGTRCWTGRIDIPPSLARNSDEVWRSVNVLLKMAWISAWHHGPAWSGPASECCISTARCSTSSSCLSWLLGNCMWRLINAARTHKNECALVNPDRIINIHSRILEKLLIFSSSRVRFVTKNIVHCNAREIQFFPSSNYLLYNHRIRVKKHNSLMWNWNVRFIIAAWKFF